jgi:hypothetical protein
MEEVKEEITTNGQKVKTYKTSEYKTITVAPNREPYSSIIDYHTA